MKSTVGWGPMSRSLIRSGQRVPNYDWHKTACRSPYGTVVYVPSIDTPLNQIESEPSSWHK